MHATRAGRTAGIGFGVVTALSVVTLSPSALAVGENLPAGSPCATIASLPFVDTGDTTGLDCNGDPITDDYDEVCPYGGSTSPEVFYTLTATEQMDANDGSLDGIVRINIFGCETAYDNKIFVYDETLAPVACVDDACTSSNGDPFRAAITDLGLDVGSTYYIAMDGWMGAAGQYEVIVDLVGPPACVFCLFPDVEEHEDTMVGAPPPPIGNNTCATTTDVMACNQVFCGTSNVWDANPPCADDADCGGEPGSCDLVTGMCTETTRYRDLDFIRLTVPVDTDTLTVRMIAEFTLELFMLFEDPDCDELSRVFAVRGAGPCLDTSVVVNDIPAGEYLLIATTAFPSFTGPIVPGLDRAYVLSVDCALDCPADFDGSGQVGFNDLTTLLAAWGACPTVP